MCDSVLSWDLTPCHLHEINIWNRLSRSSSALATINALSLVRGVMGYQVIVCNKQEIDIFDPPNYSSKVLTALKSSLLILSKKYKASHFSCCAKHRIIAICLLCLHYFWDANQSWYWRCQKRALPFDPVGYCHLAAGTNVAWIYYWAKFDNLPQFWTL